MAERGAERAHRGAIAQIALPSRDRRVGREMRKERGRKPQVTLAVLEVDRVYLVRHHRRANFALNRALAEVAERDVPPHVAREAEQDGVDTDHQVEQLGDKIVALDLGSERVPYQAHRLDEAARALDPIGLWHGGLMRIEVADRAVEFAEELLAAKSALLALQARREHRQFLAH